MNHYAILTGGPSLREHWHEGDGKIFTEVWAINKVGREFTHDYACHLDKPETIGIARDGWAGFTRRGVHHPSPEEVNAFNPLCTISFPYFLAKLFRETPPDSLVYIYGWDCAGTGIDGKDWESFRNAHERSLVSQYWRREKVKRVYGAMEEWARTRLGFCDEPVMDREVTGELA